MTFLARLGDVIWRPWLLGLFLLVGGYYSLCTGFFQIFGLRVWWRATVGSLFRRKKGETGKGTVSQLQAMSTALAATIGTGSIAGVATAVFFGGPGAVFWMWVSALLGMMTGCAEKTLAVRFREKGPDGGWRGGPMCYIREGLLFLERKRSKKNFKLGSETGGLSRSAGAEESVALSSKSKRSKKNFKLGSEKGDSSRSAGAGKSSALPSERKRSKKDFNFGSDADAAGKSEVVPITGRNTVWGTAAKGLAAMFSVLCVAQTLAGGNLVQANSIAAALNAAFGADRLAVGLVVALLVGAVALGGIGRIGKVSEGLVPAMALLFVGSGAVVLVAHAPAIPGALRDIFTCAFQPRAVLGGYGMGTAMRFGIARGVFTNEAGLGTSAIAHAAANVKDPAEQGMWGIFEVFTATVVVCTVTAMVILTSGVYTVEGAQAAIRSGNIPPELLGASLTGASFATVFGRLGPVIVSVSLLLFAFTSLLGSSYYGQRGIESLTDRREALWCYRAVYLVMIVLGCLGDVTMVWQLVDVINGLLALPNLIALLLLSPVAVKLILAYDHKKRAAR